MRWTGHIVRLDKEDTVKRITEWGPIAVRRVGRWSLNGRVLSEWSWENEV
jgi:hypothetical protein